MKKRMTISIILALVLCFGMVAPVFAGSPAVDFDFRLNTGSESDYVFGCKTDRADYADIFPRGGNVNSSSYILFNISQYKDGELKRLTYQVPSSGLEPMQIFYYNSVNMDDIQWKTLRLYATRYGQGTVSMNGIWYP